MKRITVDGNFALSNIAYMFNDIAMVYPITPSSPMSENCDKFIYENKKNLFGNNLKMTQMQSEAGVAGALHGSLLAGEKTTTFTCSQGLLLMIPNMYKIAGEGLPCVIYVSARAVATHALNIFCDYSDIYACLKTGFNIVSCSSVQEANDLAIACELASVKSKIPYICFVDGFRTSHELNTIELTELEDVLKVVNPKDLKNKNDFSNLSPMVAGTNQNPDVFMQNRVLSLSRYKNAILNFKQALTTQQQITGRQYDTIEFYGNNKAKDVIVAMGTCADVVKLAIDNLKLDIGLIKVRMLKPFDEKTFIEKLPKTVKNITILERNLDVNGEDYLSSIVKSTLINNGKKTNCFSGCYGLGGKEFTIEDVVSVAQNMKKQNKQFFTIGINDDVSNTSLPKQKIDYIDNYNFSMRVYGFGSDGSVSSVKNIIKILSDETDMFYQGYFDYDSKKSGSLTISHLRCSKNPIVAPFNPRKVDVVMCNNENYIKQYDITEPLKNNSIFILNTKYEISTLNQLMTDKMKQDLISKNVSFYTINADEIASTYALKGKINTIMQSALFHITNLIDKDKIYSKLEETILKTYSNKGQDIIDANLKAIKNVKDNIKQIDLNLLTLANLVENECVNNEYYKNIILPTSNQKGDEIATSKFNQSGFMPTNTAKFEKRTLPKQLPNWISEICIQCGRCSMMCPHSALTPIVTKDKTPKEFITKKAFSQDGEYRMQNNPFNCTGCGVCSTVCPVKAIIMADSEQIRDKEIKNYQTLAKLTNTAKADNDMVKNLQFKPSYFDFNGACAGCGETPYIKLVTQLFGDRMLIANATGCSSINGGTYPCSPYKQDELGFGASWANSLFEDNAEFGLGIYLARKNQRENFINSLKNTKFSKKINDLLENFIKNPENHIENKELIVSLQKYKLTHKIKENEKFLFENLHLITSPSVWIVGGDGWAYDIGFGGLDHVVASGENVNILILDTEVYSNTGGQTSKSTPRGATAKFNITGKTTKKKDLASMLLTYKDVYVAKVSMGANPEQCLKAFVEAEQYNGPSVIIAYSPCINHGYDMKYSQIHCLNSVKSGYNTLFRYNPNNKEKMQIDSFEPSMDYEEFINSENRFAILNKVNKTNKNSLIKQNKKDAEIRNENYKKLKK